MKIVKYTFVWMDEKNYLLLVGFGVAGSWGKIGDGDISSGFWIIGRRLDALWNFPFYFIAVQS